MVSGLSLWLSGLIRFLSHSTCWAYLSGDLQGPGIKPGSRHGLSVGWTNGRYAMRLISRTSTEGPPVSSLNCDRCRLWSYDITAGYKCEYYIRGACGSDTGIETSVRYKSNVRCSQHVSTTSRRCVCQSARRRPTQLGAVTQRHALAPWQVH